MRIAELHGGTIEIDSRAGESSCFALVMPAAGLPAAPSAPGAASLDPA